MKTVNQNWLGSSALDGIARKDLPSVEPRGPVRSRIVPFEGVNEGQTVAIGSSTDGDAGNTQTPATRVLGFMSEPVN